MNEGPILAIDGTGLLVRCNRAARHARLYAADGTPTGALMMFINSLARKIRWAQPGYVVVAWDGPHSTKWRREMYPGYKAGHPDIWRMGEELAGALEFCAAANIYQLKFPGFEADDILAAVTRTYAWSERLVMICSDDQDMLQLADDAPLCGLGRVMVTGLTRDHMITAADVREQWGVRPMRLPMLRALAGDVSDCVPGVPGIGPKRAARLLQTLGWRYREMFIKDPDQLRLAEIYRDIMDLVIPVRPVEHEMGIAPLTDIGTLGRWQPGGGQNVLNLLERYEMEQIANRLREGALW